MCFMLLIQACGGSDKSSESKIITEETATATEVEVDNDEENDLNVGYIKKIVFICLDEENHKFFHYIIVKKNRKYYLFEVDSDEKCSNGLFEFKYDGNWQGVFIKKNRDDFDYEAIAKESIRCWAEKHTFEESDAMLQELLKIAKMY